MEKISFAFGTANIPAFPTSVSLNSYAIDPQTARTAVGEVNHHYLYRYGTLFASSFLSGVLSSYTGHKPCRVPLGPAGSAISILFPQPTSGNIDWSGKGWVEIGTQFQSEFDRKSTIKSRAERVWVS